MMIDPFEKLVFYILIWERMYTRSGNANCQSQFSTAYEGEQNSTYLIGGIFPVHYYSNREGRYILNPSGLAWVEAMLFSVEEINNSSVILPNITLGYKIYDGCNSVNKTLESALEIVEGFNSYGKHINCSYKNYFNPAIALIGGASSKTTSKLAAILSASKTPHISYSCTSTDLTASNLYPSFLRTIPPDNFQALLITDLLQKFNWSFVNIVAMDDKYGRVGVMELLRELKRAKICVSIKEIYNIRNDNNRTTSLIQRLKARKEATVVILWCERFDALNILREAERLKLYHRTWVGTETYANSDELFTIHHKVIQGMFGVIPYQVNYDPFIQKLETITPNNSGNNPWLDEYWRKIRRGVKLPKGNGISGYDCKDEGINLSALPTNKHTNVINAVYAVAYGLHNYIEQEKIKSKIQIKHATLLKYIKEINFTGKDDTIVSFDDDGNPIEARYFLTNLHYNLTTKQYNYVTVGTWYHKGEYINMNITSELQFANFSKSCPISSCAESCRPGYKGVIFGDLPCCWKCVRCPPGEVQPMALKLSCTKCEGYTVTNHNQTRCIEPSVTYLKVNDPYGVLLILFVTSGYIIVITSMVIFCINKHTAIMNASNKELSWIQLVSFIFLLAFPLAGFNRNITTYTCTIQNFYFVCFYTIVMSITFTKADRLLRVFNAGKIGILRCRERSNMVQLVTVGVLTVFGLLLLTFVHFTLPTNVDKYYTNSSNGRVYITFYCSGNYDTHLFIGIAYIGVIALICGVYAFKARRLPETFNEARYTSFAMFTFLLTWMMFVPIYFSTDSHTERRVRWCIMSLAVTIKLFLLMYMKKLYIIIFRPLLNTKEHVAGEIKAFNTALAKKSVAN